MGTAGIGFELTEKNKARLCTAITRLATLAGNRQPGPREPFERVGLGRTRRELEVLAAAAEQADPTAFMDAISTLHEAAIVSLANAGILRPIDPCRPNLSADIRTAASRVPAYPDPPGGRPRENRACLVAQLVMHDYHELTGENPEVAGERDRLARLVGGVFNALGITANPRAMIDAAIKAGKEARSPLPPKSPPTGAAEQKLTAPPTPADLNRLAKEKIAIDFWCSSKKT